MEALTEQNLTYTLTLGAGSRAAADRGVTCGLRELVTAAKAGIENLNPDEAAAEIDRGDVLVVDVREPGEITGGILPTAVLTPRGVLEQHADPASPEHRAWFAPERRVIVYSGTGSRSALAAATLQDLGYRDVAHLDGGYLRWVEEGQPVLAPDARSTGRVLPGAPHVEFTVPDDPARSLVRVRMDGAWVGDLLPASVPDRESLLEALTAGAVSVVRCPIPLADPGIAERP